MATAFQGMRGVGDWVTNEAPENWRELILELNPNGSMLLTGLAAMANSEPVDSTRFHWFTRTMSSQSGAVTSIYIDSALVTEYVYASHQALQGVTNATVYAKMALALAKEFRIGHQVLLRDADQYSVDINAKVVDVLLNGASSYVACKLLEADDNGSTPATYNLATVDRIIINGNINPQGGTRPDAITYDPTQIDQYTGISRTPLDLTRSGMKEKLRTRDAYQDAKDQALLYHGVELEKQLIWSILSSNTNLNGQREQTPMGIIQFIKTYAAANVDDFSLSTDTNYAGKTWEQGGERWLDEFVKKVFDYTADQPGVLGGERLAICGGGALLGIQRLVKELGMYTLEKETIAYGIKVVRWTTVFGDILLKTHPLFSQETTNSNTMLIIPPDQLIERPFDETFFMADEHYRKGGGSGYDGKQEEWLTEMAHEFHHAPMWAYLNGVGVDNSV